MRCYWEHFKEHIGNLLGTDCDQTKKQKIYWFKAGIGSSQYQYSNQHYIAKVHLIY
jgi:hypothetical protein